MNALIISETAVKIILQVIVIFCFIGVFFFTYASHIEKNIVINQTDDIVDDLTGNLKKILPDNVLSLLKVKFNQISKPDLSSEDLDIQNSNNLILRKAIESMFAISISLLFLTLLIILFFHIDMHTMIDIFKETFVILLFVGFVEFTFLTFFAQNYRTIDSNFVKSKIINSLIQ